MHYFCCTSNILVLNSYTWLMATMFASTGIRVSILTGSSITQCCSVLMAPLITPLLIVGVRKWKTTYRESALKRKRRVACITTKSTLSFPLYGFDNFKFQEVLLSLKSKRNLQVSISQMWWHLLKAHMCQNIFQLRSPLGRGSV